jgi:hypothetical protein
VVGVYTEKYDSSTHKKILVPVDDGSVIKWSIIEGSGGSLSANETNTTAGNALVTLTTSTSPGTTYKIQARVIVLKINGRTRNYGSSGPLAITSAEIEVIVGQAANVTSQLSKNGLPPDNTSTLDLTVTAKDAFDNLVPDGTPVSWSLDGLGDIPQQDEVTTNGQATATVLSGFLEGDQTISAQIDSFVLPVTVPDTGISVTLTTSLSDLHVNSGDGIYPTSAQISVHITDGSGVPVADGSEITLFASNGNFTDGISNLGTILRTTTTNGNAFTTLNANGARLGSTLVSVGITNFASSLRINFLPTIGLSISTNQIALSGDAIADGTLPILQYDGSYKDTPYFSTAVAQIKGGSPNTYCDVALSGAGKDYIKLSGGHITTTILLDGIGAGSVNLESNGNFVPNLDALDLKITASTTNANAVHAPLKVVSKHWYSSLYDFSSGFYWGDSHGAAGTAGDFASGMLFVGNIRDIAKQMGIWSTGQKPSWVICGFAAFGIVADFFPEGLSEFFAIVRVIISKIPAPLLNKFSELIIEIGNKCIDYYKNGNFQTAFNYINKYTQFLTVLVAKGDAVVVKLSSIISSKIGLDALVNLRAKVGDAIIDRIYAIANDIDEATAQETAIALENVSTSVLNGIINSSDAMEGIARTIKQYPSTTVKDILENVNAYTSSYKQINLYEDLNKILTQNPNVLGLRSGPLGELVTQRTIAAQGASFEICAAGHIADAEHIIQFKRPLVEGVDIDITTDQSLFQAKKTWNTFISQIDKKYGENNGLVAYIDAVKRVIISEGGKNFKLVFPISQANEIPSWAKTLLTDNGIPLIYYQF